MPKLPDGIVNIRGRQYETVALRVQKFRAEHPTWSLVTEIIHRDEQCVVMKASINVAEVTIATGHAEEYRKASEINRTSALENCETSAIGRALAALGFGGTEFASADEVARAVSGQKGEAGGSATDALRKAFEERQPAVQDKLRTEAQVICAHTTGKAAHFAAEQTIAEAASLGEDDPLEVKKALWYLLDSQTRSAIKKAAEKEASE
jgi:hypothetical protein